MRKISLILVLCVLVVFSVTGIAIAIENANDQSQTLNTELNELIQSDDFWTVEGLAAYRKKYSPIIEVALSEGFYVHDLFVHLAEIPYSLPDSQSISKDDALRIAQETIYAFGWKKSLLDLYTPSISYREYDAEIPEWRIGYTIAEDDDFNKYVLGDIPYGVVVNIEARTGNVISIAETTEANFYTRFGEFPDNRDKIKPEEGVG